MIVDLIDQAADYYRIGPRLKAGLRFLRKTDLAGLQNGRHEISGAAVYALVSEYRTKPKEEGRWEAHRRYIDIQCLVSGEEIVGYAPLAGLKVTQAYDAERDCLFLEGAGEFLVLRPGMFVVFLPQDAHQPGLAVGGPVAVKKIVVKVRVIE